VTEANKKYNALVMSTAKKEEDLKKKFEQEIADLRKSLAAGQKSAAEALAAKKKNWKINLRLLKQRKILF
jgi:serologically defined colon cancer antigen 8